ncbi:hypothetical protein, partial [Anaerotignum sp.]|uniref:hypothetical protein n=1 Tax=Anaerotignum sp. TaxID=2039241 RepID=UPI0027152E1D
MKIEQNILRDKITTIHKQIGRCLLTGVLCVAMTASGLFLGCAEAKETNITLSQQQEEEVVALLGDLNENV